MEDLHAFMSLIGAMNSQIVPEADAEDLRSGAKHIPSEVTAARRAGRDVPFTRQGELKDWYWTLGDQKIYHGEWQ